MSNNYFTGDRLFWDDPDFKTTEEKIVYAMLWQSVTTDIAGIHIRNDKIDANRVCIGYRKYIDTLSILYRKGKIKIYDTKIWVKSAIWYNLFKGKYSRQQLKAISNRIPTECAKDIIQYYKDKYNITIPYRYPIHTLSIPYCTETETESETKTETDKKKIFENQIQKDKIKWIYKNYINIHKPKRYDLTEKRKRKIEARLKEFTPGEIWASIVAISWSDFHMGRKEGTTKKYNDLADHILRNKEQTEKWVNIFVEKEGDELIKQKDRKIENEIKSKREKFFGGNKA